MLPNWIAPNKVRHGPGTSLPVGYGANDAPLAVDQTEIAKYDAENRLSWFDAVQVGLIWRVQLWSKEMSEQDFPFWCSACHNTPRIASIAKGDGKDRAFRIWENLSHRSPLGYQFVGWVGPCETHHLLGGE